MVSLRLIQIFTALSLYVESVKGDCTSCPVATLACDPNPGDLNAVNGIFSQTVGNDTNGCMTLTFHCTDDSGAGEFGYIYKDVRLDFSKVPLFSNIFRTISSKMEIL